MVNQKLITSAIDFLFMISHCGRSQTFTASHTLEAVLVKQLKQQKQTTIHVFSGNNSIYIKSHNFKVIEQINMFYTCPLSTAASHCSLSLEAFTL